MSVFLGFRQAQLGHAQAGQIFSQAVFNVASRKSDRVAKVFVIFSKRRVHAWMWRMTTVKASKNRHR